MAFSEHRSVRRRRANETRGDRGWRQSCCTAGNLEAECRSRITSAQIPPRVSGGIGGRTHRIACRASWPPFASFRPDAPLCEKSGREEWTEGLQRRLTYLSRKRGQGCSHGEYGFHAARYLPGLYGLRWDDAGAERQLEGSDRAWRAITWTLADHACVRRSADGPGDQRCDRVHAGVLQECPPRSAGRAKSATGIGYGEGVSRERDCDFYGGECIRSAGVDYGCH